MTAKDNTLKERLVTSDRYADNSSTEGKPTFPSLHRRPARPTNCSKTPQTNLTQPDRKAPSMSQQTENYSKITHRKDHQAVSLLVGPLSAQRTVMRPPGSELSL